MSLSSSSVAPSSINSVAVSDRKGAQLGGVMSSPNAVLANGGSANVGNSCSTLKQASQQQLPAMDRLTCHLCNRTLSRRDKLKRHLVRCCEMYGRDVEIALNVAGFTSKDVDVRLCHVLEKRLITNRIHVYWHNEAVLTSESISLILQI